MIRVAIGPEMPLPSWNWVGLGLFDALQKHYHVQPFRETIPTCDVAIVIKFFLPQFLLNNHAKVIYLPIDRYTSPAALNADAPMLKRCAAIGCHTELLIPYFQPHCPKVFFIEHHAKYALPSLSPFKKEGFVLWIGAFEFVPYLFKWLASHPLTLPLYILTNFHEPRSRSWANALAKQLSIPLNISSDQLNGHALFAWSEPKQQELLSQAKAAIDIKAGNWLEPNCWAQQTKPPTKGQKYIASGIPFAINRDSYTYAYFQQRGLELATPDDEPRWFSHEYWEQTQHCAATLKPALTLESVGESP